MKWCSGTSPIYLFFLEKRFEKCVMILYQNQYFFDLDLFWTFFRRFMFGLIGKSWHHCIYKVRMLISIFNDGNIFIRKSYIYIWNSVDSNKNEEKRENYLRIFEIFVMILYCNQCFMIYKDLCSYRLTKVCIVNIEILWWKHIDLEENLIFLFNIL